MNRGIESTARGMMATQKWMDMTANNLANATTTGYKRDCVAFNEAFERELAANGGLGQKLGSLGSGPELTGEFPIFEKGALTQTGNPLDLAIDEERGAFAIQTSTGTRYTRNGAFQLSDQGDLVTAQGNPVLDDRGAPIHIGQGKIEVAPTGEISVDGRQVAKLGLYDGSFTKEGANLFSSTNAQPIEGHIRQGALEQSNVNAVESMISMINIGRSYELAQKSMTSQDELTQRLIQALQER